MSTTFHRRLRTCALGLAALNLATCLLADMREWIVYFDPWFCRLVVFQTFVLGLAALPFLVPRKDSDLSRGKMHWLMLVAALLVLFEATWLFMIAIGTFFRGPDWNFYWPWEERLPKLVALNNVDLTEYFWVFCMDQPRPANLLLRESPGIAILLLVCVVLPVAVAVVARKQTGFAWWRIFLFAFITQLFLVIICKIALRLLISLKYFVAAPEWMLNI